MDSNRGPRTKNKKICSDESIDEFQAIVDHSRENYNCEKRSDCPYTGTTIINKIPWAGEKDLDDSSEIRRGNLDC